MDPMGRNTFQSGYLGCEVTISPDVAIAAIFERCSAPNPRCSIRPIYLQNWVVLGGPNVGKYTIH